MNYVPIPPEWIAAAVEALEYNYPEWHVEANNWNHDHQNCRHRQWPHAAAVAREVIAALRELGVVHVEPAADR